MEIGLRLAPGIVPMALLTRFHPPVRVEVAKRRYLPNETTVRQLERDDDGPPLKVLLPHARIEYDFPDTGEEGTVVMDGMGFSNAPENDYRLPEIEIIAVGDSFAVPHPPSRPELSWPAQLGRLTGRSLYVLGRGGTGVYEYVQLLDQFGIAKKPEIVVMQIYAGNDLRDALRYQRWRSATPEERAAMPDYERSRHYELHAYFDNALGRNSYVYNTLVVALAMGVRWVQEQQDPSSRIDFRYRLDFPEGPVEMNVENSDLDEVRNARRLRSGESSLEVFDEALESYAALSREHGFVPVLTYVPSAYSAYADFVTFYEPELAELMPWFCDRQRDHFRRKAEELGLVFLDLTPAMRARAEELHGGDLLYLPRSVHFGLAGHRTVAETVARALADAAPDGRAENDSRAGDPSES